MLEVVKRIFGIQFWLIVIAVFAGVNYERLLGFVENGLQSLQDYSPNELNNENEQLYSIEELKSYNGENERPLYLALLGNVYDVSKGEKHYGPGCSYNYFVGRDASVSFVSGQFDSYDAATADDVVGQLTPKDLLNLDNWKSFYDNDYILKGKLIGRFYDEHGNPTTYYHKYIALLDQARNTKAEEEQLRQKYPDCNIEWSEEKGTRVWCTTNSGGISREWIGHPRKFFEVGADSYRCTCIRAEELDAKDIMLKTYDNCDILSHECFYNVD